MNYRIGPTWMHSVNCMLLPTIVIYDDGAHRRERFSACRCGNTYFKFTTLQTKCVKCEKKKRKRETKKR